MSCIEKCGEDIMFRAFTSKRADGRWKSVWQQRSSLVSEQEAGMEYGFSGEPVTARGLVGVLKAVVTMCNNVGGTVVNLC